MLGGQSGGGSGGRGVCGLTGLLRKVNSGGNLDVNLGQLGSGLWGQLGHLSINACAIEKKDQCNQWGSNSDDHFGTRLGEYNLQEVNWEVKYLSSEVNLEVGWWWSVVLTRLVVLQSLIKLNWELNWKVLVPVERLFLASLGVGTIAPRHHG